MKQIARQFTLKTDEDYPETISVVDDPEDLFEYGNLYSVIQRGVWWWRSFSISYYIADIAAGGCNSGGWWIDVKPGFKTREEALAALYAGDFPLRH